jgi:hypothetical protein
MEVREDVFVQNGIKLIKFGCFIHLIIKKFPSVMFTEVMICTCESRIKHSVTADQCHAVASFFTSSSTLSQTINCLPSFMEPDIPSPL